jgi:hypothetical protein
MPVLATFKPLSLTIACLLLGAILLAGCSSNSSSNSTPKASASSTTSEDEGHAHKEKGHAEIATYMARYQRYTDKLYFAGKAGNWPLAEFYMHELKETSEELIEVGAIEDGMDISKLTELQLSPKLKQLDKTIDNKSADAFEGQYQNLVNTCNSCHQMTKHDFVVIKKPERPTYSNQVFEPQDSPVQ